MKSLLLLLTFIFLGIIAPVFLLSMLNPGSFATILAWWSVLATVSYLVLWVFLRNRRHV